MSELAKSFLELPGVSIDDAHVAVLPVPFEGTVCYGKGTGQGPAAILAASHHLLEFICPTAPHEVACLACEDTFGFGPPGEGSDCHHNDQ